MVCDSAVAEFVWLIGRPVEEVDLTINFLSAYGRTNHGPILIAYYQ